MFIRAVNHTAACWADVLPVKPGSMDTAITLWISAHKTAGMATDGAILTAPIPILIAAQPETVMTEPTSVRQKAGTATEFAMRIAPIPTPIAVRRTIAATATIKRMSAPHKAGITTGFAISVARILIPTAEPEAAKQAGACVLHALLLLIDPNRAIHIQKNLPLPAEPLSAGCASRTSPSVKRSRHQS